MNQTRAEAVPIPQHSEFRWWLLLATLLATCVGANASDDSPLLPDTADPHITDAGFFDIHVCNWPDRPLFLMALFSTEMFKQIASVEIRTPDNKSIGTLDKRKFLLIKRKNKPEKRVFISHLELPRHARDGWYRAEISLQDGSRYMAKDFVIIRSMALPTGIQPENEAEIAGIPRKLMWKPIIGAKLYQVFIRDEWSGELIYQSDLLSKSELILPEGLLQKGGYYSWRIHSRDVNENILLGDFNHGSLSRRRTFSIADSFQSAQKN